MRFLYSIIWGLGLVFASSVCAQEVIHLTDGDFEFTPEPNAPSSLIFSPEARYVPEANEFIFTEDKFYGNKNVRAFLRAKNPVCFKDAIISYEAYMGDRASGGGDIILWTTYRQDLKDPVAIAELDTFEDGYACPTCTKFNWPWEINNLHTAIETKLPNGTFGTAAVQTVPFQLIDNKWKKIEFRNNKGSVDFRIDNGTDSPFFISAKAEYRENASTWISFAGSTRMEWTNAANLQKIRNIKITILEGCDSLSATQALDLCDPNQESNSCPLAIELMTSIENSLGDLRNTGQITSTVYNQAIGVLESRAYYCEGKKNCDFIDVDALKKASFDEGHSVGYSSGYSTGKNSVDTEAIKLSSYNTGFTDGVASVDTSEAEQRGYDRGFYEGSKSCEEDQQPSPSEPGPFTGVDEARDLVSVVCPCNGFATHGKYVSCMTKFLNNLLAIEVIDQDTRNTLQVEAARSSCGKPSKRVNNKKRGSRVMKKN